MRKIITLSLLVAALSVSACAKRASSVSPVAMTGAFDAQNCQKATDMLASERETMAALAKEQNAAATGDAIGVFLLAVPVSSVFGADVEGQLATSKGKVLALEQRVARCS